MREIFIDTFVCRKNEKILTKYQLECYSKNYKQTANMSSGQKKNQYIDKYTILNFVREDQYMAHQKLMLKQFCELCIKIITD